MKTVQDYCLTFPGAYIDYPWGEPVVKVGKKIFVFFGRSQDVVTVTVKLTEELRELWLQRPDAYIPAYVGRYGWCGLHLVHADAWDLAQEGIAVSYQLVTRRRSTQSRQLT